MHRKAASALPFALQREASGRRDHTAAAPALLIPVWSSHRAGLRSNGGASPYWETEGYHVSQEAANSAVIIGPNLLVWVGHIGED